MIAGQGVGGADGSDDGPAGARGELGGRPAPARATQTSCCLLDDVRDAADFLEERGHRAIGVVYHPEYEHFGNYVPTVLPRRYDAFCYLDETHALHPLHLHPALEKVPETYPWGCRCERSDRERRS